MTENRIIYNERVPLQDRPPAEAVVYLFEDGHVHLVITDAATQVSVIFTHLEAMMVGSALYGAAQVHLGMPTAMLDGEAGS